MKLKTVGFWAVCILGLFACAQAPLDRAKTQMVYLQKQDYPGSYVSNFYIPDTEVEKIQAAGKYPIFAISQKELEQLYPDYNPADDAPLIGVLFNREGADYAIPASYIYSVIKAGARVRVLSFDNLERQVEGLDGILLTGGDFDWPADFYAVAPQADLPTPGKRYQAYEFLTRYAMRHHIPLLGICAGMEAMSYLLGAGEVKFSDDIASQTGVHHRSIPAVEVAHTVLPQKGGHLARIVGEQAINVNSRHFQGTMPKWVQGGQVKISGLSPDGVVEAVEFPQYPTFFAVQFHPEVFAWRGDSISQKIFDAFVQDAHKYRTDKQYQTYLNREILFTAQ